MADDNTGDRITFSCVECGHAVSIDKSNPPDDDDILKCFGCGREIGPYGVVKAALIAAGKAEVDKLFMANFGKKPIWGKG